MAASDTLTFDQSPPRRPALDDVGGAAFENDPDAPPDPTIEPSAEMWNQISKLAAAFGAVVPVAVVSVGFSGTTPLLLSTAYMPTTPPAPTLTRESAGQTTVTWPSGTFPNAMTEPTATANYAGGNVGVSVVRINSGGLQGVRVYTTVAGASTDIPFTVAMR